MYLCRAELFTKEVELRERYPQAHVDKVLHVREMYNWFFANPDGADREFVAEVCQRHGIHRTTAYSDPAVVKSLLPMLGSASRDFLRWHTNEMLIATYKMTEQRKDSKTMERAATAVKLSTLKMWNLRNTTLNLIRFSYQTMRS